MCLIDNSRNLPLGWWACARPSVCCSGSGCSAGSRWIWTWPTVWSRLSHFCSSGPSRSWWRPAICTRNWVRVCRTRPSALSAAAPASLYRTYSAPSRRRSSGSPPATLKRKTMNFCERVSVWPLLPYRIPGKGGVRFG